MTSGSETTDLRRVMEAIEESKRTMEEKFQSLKDEMRKSQEEVTESVVRKVKSSRQPDFRRKGNEKQFKFNDAVAEKLEEVGTELENVNKEGATADVKKEAVDRATKLVKEGKDLIEARQKMIRLADRSEYGWDIVNEYEADELAADSEDEKRITKAEKAAEKAAEKRLVKRRKTSLVSARSRFQFKAANVANTAVIPTQSWPARSSFSVGNIGPGATTSRAPKVIGPCFGCGEFGHLKHACKSTATPTVGTPKLYPYDIDVCMSEVHSGELSTSEWVKCGSLVEPVIEMCNTESCVKGRLCSRLEFWEKELQSPKPVLNIVRQGYILPFRSVPESRFFKNQSSALKHKEFVSQAVIDLVSYGCVVELKDPPFVCNPLLVVTSRSGKKRLVVNLRYINQHLQIDKFKYEDMRTGLMFFEQGEYLITFDLKSGYHHVDIHEKSQCFLGFQWNCRYYMFTVLPFGLATACYIFTKLLRPLVRLWRSKGIKAIVYIDDGIIVAPGLKQARECSTVVRETLEAAGFVTNQAKCNWEPAQVQVWLGYCIDLAEGRITIPVEKIVDLKGLLGSCCINFLWSHLFLPVLFHQPVLLRTTPTGSFKNHQLVLLRTTNRFF